MLFSAGNLLDTFSGIPYDLGPLFWAIDPTDLLWGGSNPANLNRLSV